MPRKKTVKRSSFVALERTLLHSRQWKGLSGPAKILYMHVKARYDGHNNGDIGLAYTAMRGVQGCSSSSVIWPAFKELIKKGWIKRNQAGGMYRKINTYEITWKFDKYDGGTINKSKYDKK